MNRIVLIGNGFDMAHGLKTSYNDFINWYKVQRPSVNESHHSRVTDDGLSRYISQSKTFWGHFDNFFVEARDKYVFKSLLERIDKSAQENGWVDIENEYYRLLIEYSLTNYSTTKVIDLNNQLYVLQNKLIEYLLSINQQNIVLSDKIKKNIYSTINSFEISIGSSGIVNNDMDIRRDGRQESIQPEKIMLLSFNYTNTVQAYQLGDKQNVVPIYIHGTLEKPKTIIFGYGDEIDNDFEKLKNMNNNECLRNMKSIKYLETGNYRKMLAFIDSAPYQVFIMGHSCGMSDRTLLNTLFEHKNCISIKPFYYIKDNGTDNYFDLVLNISRNFTDMKLMRDRVVNKEFCETLV